MVDTNFGLANFQAYSCNWDKSEDGANNFGPPRPQQQQATAHNPSALWTMPQTAQEIGRAQVAQLGDTPQSLLGTVGLVDHETFLDKLKEFNLVDVHQRGNNPLQISTGVEPLVGKRACFVDKTFGDGSSEDEDHIPIWKGPFGMEGRFGDLNAVKKHGQPVQDLSPRHCRITKEDPASALSESDGCGYDVDTRSGSSVGSQKDGGNNAWVEKLSAENFALKVQVREMQEMDCSQRAQIANLEAKIEALELKKSGGSETAMDAMNKRNEELTKQVTQLKVYVKSKEKQILTYRDELTKVYGRFPSCTGQAGVGCGWQTRFPMETNPQRLGGTGRQPSPTANAKMLLPRQTRATGGRVVSTSQPGVRKPKEVLCVNKKTGQVECKDTVPEYSHRRRRGV